MKKENGSITIFVLVALIFMVAFLILSYASNINKSKTAKEQYDIINDIYQYSEQGLEDKRIANTKINKGDFVEYNVAYTDASQTTYQYTNENGWRLLDFTNNEDGTYRNVKLISTGIPAKIEFTNSDSETTNDSWFEKDALKLENFREILGGNEYPLYAETQNYRALQVAAGMYYNFGNIKFAYVDSGGRGGSLGIIKTITSNGITYDSSNIVEKSGEELFNLYGNKATIRSLTLPEVNKALGREDIKSLENISDTEDSVGLYNLRQLRHVEGMENYLYEGADFFWLASPAPDTTTYLQLCFIANVGIHTLNYYTGGIWGLRPVICLNGNVKLVDGDNNGALEIYFE